MKDYLKCIKDFKASYDKIKNALPWLDCAVYENEKTVFPGYAEGVKTSFVKTAELRPDSDIGKLKAEGVQILRYNTENCPIEKIYPLFGEIEKYQMPLSLLHTQVSFEKMEEIASENPLLNIIIESGDRKLIYHIEKVFKTLKNHRNIYLCSYNFCNWMGHEKLIEEGLEDRLLYGSHGPEFCADVMMAPIIKGHFSWKTKCDFAGNNLRRLLNMSPVEVPEDPFLPVAAFIIDAHTHNQQPGEHTLNGFPTSDMNYDPQDWIKYMDYITLEQLILIPMEAIQEGKSASDFSEQLIKSAPGRFAYMEVFNPTLVNAAYIERFRNSLQNKTCVGIKIHPSSHKVEADDKSYELVFQLAEEYGKPIMTHSWDVSDYNPVQYMSHPDRFRKHLEKYHKTPFVLGHAGGRPGAFNATVKLCMDFDNVYLDFAGDYYYNGVIDAFADKIGAARMLYASDVNWFDPRGNIGLFLGSSLNEADLLKTFRNNAIKVYLSGKV